MESFNPKLLEDLKQRNVQINFNFATTIAENPEKVQSAFAKQIDFRDLDSETSTVSSLSEKQKMNHSGQSFYSTETTRNGSELSSFVLSRPTTAGDKSARNNSTVNLGFKIRPTTAKDMLLTNVDSVSKTASEMGRMKGGFNTQSNWKLSSLHEPEKVEEEFEDDFLRDLEELNAEKLSKLLLLDESKLSSVKSLETKVDLSYSSLNVAGEILSNLIELKLNGSILKSLRDIGNSFQKLEVLWVSNCGLKDLAGINSFSNLKEIYASYNSINDVSDLMFKVSLNVIDLEGNEIKDINNIQNLIGLEDLYAISVDGNPFTEKDPDYRKKVAEILPQVKIIDDEDVQIIQTTPSQTRKSNEEAKHVQDIPEEMIEKIVKLNVMSRSELQQSVRDLLKATTIEEPNEESLITMSVKQKHSKASNVEVTAKRLRGKNVKNAILTEDTLDLTQKRPSTAKVGSKNYSIKPQIKPDNNIFSPYSDLTQATDEFFSGNPLKALRHKRQNTFVSSKQIGQEVIITQAKNILDLFTEFSHFTRDDELEKPVISSEESRESSFSEDVDALNKDFPVIKRNSSSGAHNATNEIQTNSETQNPFQVMNSLKIVLHFPVIII